MHVGRAVSRAHLDPDAIGSLLRGRYSWQCAWHMANARLIDDAYAVFLSSVAGQNASAQKLDALACWPWPVGFIPSPSDFERLCDALGGASSAADDPRQTQPRRPTGAIAQGKVAG